MFLDSVYTQRRRALMESIGSGLVVLPGNELIGMNYRANTFPFCQDGSFLYFAGLNEPDFLLCLDCDSNDVMLYGPERGLDHALWSGASLLLEEAARRVGIERVGSFSDAAVACRNALAQGRTIHYLPPYQGCQVLRLARLLGWSVERVEAGASVPLIRSIVDLRSVKTAAEISEIRAAVDVSAEMYWYALRNCRAGLSEMELYGRLQGLMLSKGGVEAFPMILSRHGDILHNHAHDQVLATGDLLLIDSGVRSALGYASDVTRTLPVSGKFSALQRDIYSVVLAAQSFGVAAMVPGTPFRDCHLAAAKSIVEGLRDLGFMHGDADEAVAAGAHALFFPHGLGHMLGLDVHDMEGLGENFVGYDQEFQRSRQFGLAGLRMARRLRPGFVMTVEPGIYFIRPLVAQWKAQGLHKAFIDYSAVEACLGFGGIRIEDDVVVTESGAEVLTSSIPKTITKIEEIMEYGG